MPLVNDTPPKNVFFFICLFSHSLIHSFILYVCRGWFFLSTLMRQTLSSAAVLCTPVCTIPGNSSVSTSHILIEVLGLHISTTTSSFFMGSGGPNSGHQAYATSAFTHLPIFCAFSHHNLMLSFIVHLSHNLLCDYTHHLNLKLWSKMFTQTYTTDMSNLCLQSV